MSDQAEPELSYEERAALRAAKRASRVSSPPPAAEKTRPVSTGPAPTPAATSTGRTQRKKWDDSEYQQTTTTETQATEESSEVAQVAEEEGAAEVAEENGAATYAEEIAEAVTEEIAEAVSEAIAEEAVQQQLQEEDRHQEEEDRAEENVVEEFTITQTETTITDSVDAAGDVTETVTVVETSVTVESTPDIESDYAALNKPKRASRRFGGEEPSRASPARSVSPAREPTSAPVSSRFSASTPEKTSTTPKRAENAKLSSATTSKFEKSAQPTLTPAAAEIPRRVKPASTAPADENSPAAVLVKRIVEMDEEVTWGLFDIENNELVVYRSGNGTVDDLRKHLEPTVALYGYIRVGLGAEQRTKFVFIRYVGDKVTPMTRARILNNEAIAKKIIKIFHIEIPTNFTDELQLAKVTARLAKAAGANYDKDQNEGSNKSGNTAFNQYKYSSREFFESKEREGTLKSVVYTKAPLPKTTPVDLNARKFTVGATQGQKNIVLDVPGVDSKKE